MAIWDNFLDAISRRIADAVLDRAAAQTILEARAYRLGGHSPQLRVKPGQFDDNIGINLSGLLANRIASQMLGRGFALDFEGEAESEQARYVNRVLEANKREVLFHRCALAGIEAGTGYLMIRPNAQVGEDGEIYPRLQLVDSMLVSMDTDPEDYEIVVRYVIQYKFTAADGKEHGRRRVIEHVAPEIDSDGQQTGGNNWLIVDYEESGGKWTETGRIVWDYDFPPILHWQNLPSITGAQGEPDLTHSQIRVADRVNFISSNNSKIIRLFAHPMRYSRGYTGAKITIGPDEMPNLPKDGEIVQLAALGDLAASVNYENGMRQAFFSVARVVDLDSLKDKLGQLTNFGLRVLYADNLALIDTHRELFGDMLEELARRLQILNGMEPALCKVIWPDFLPVDDAAAQSAITGDLANGLVSKQTAAKQRGYDWKQESERIEGEKQSEENIGAYLLRQYNQGQAVTPFARQTQGNNGNGNANAGSV